MGKVKSIVLAFFTLIYLCESAKINTPRVLLPWLESVNVNFTFEINEGGCYTWSLSRDDIIDLEPIYEDTWSHCSRSARVSVSRSCVPPSSVIILAEEVSSGEILRGDVDVDKIHSLELISTTLTLYLEEAPEAFEVYAYDDQGNKFTTLEGVSFTWSIENIGSSAGDALLVNLVPWSGTDYEAPKGVTELEAQGLYSHSILLYGQAMGQSRVTACIGHICTNCKVQVIASVVLMPATALIAMGDTLRYRVVRAKAGRLTIQDISETLYYLKVPETSVAVLEDAVSLIRGSEIGTTTVQLLSGSTEVASATLSVVEPHSIRVTLRPPNLLIRGDPFIIHCAVLDAEGHLLTSGSEILIRLTVDGEANVDLIRSTENGTLTDAVANNAGGFTVTAKLHSISGKLLSKKIEGQVSAVVVEPLEIVPPELFMAWTNNIQDILLKHRGGGDEEVVWSESETANGDLSVTPSGVVTVRSVGDIGIKVHLKKYPYVRATGRVYSAPLELVQVSSSGLARVGRPHYLHVALTATHPVTGELYNFHRCDCAAFAVTLLEGPEPHNVTAATWVEPIEGACCVLSSWFSSRGVCSLRVSLGRAGDAARVAVRAAPVTLWPDADRVALLPHASVPVIAEGEVLIGSSADPRTAELTARDGLRPHTHPDAALFTLKCHRKGETRVELTSHSDEEPESVSLEAACAPSVARVRLEPPDTPAECSGHRVWLRPGQEVPIKVTLFDSISRELLDERGPKVSWDTEPYHGGIEYRSTDRLFVETHPDYAPVPVPSKYYQTVVAEDKAIGWSGVLKASIPDATASIQAKVVAPLKCDPIKVNVAWEGDVLSGLSVVTGGSGRYRAEAGDTSAAEVVEGRVALGAPGPGVYDVRVTDACLPPERVLLEITVEEILTVEVSTARAIGVGSCVPISALVKGVSHRYLSTTKSPEYRAGGDVAVRNGTLCGLREGAGRVRAAAAGVWSQDMEVIVFPPLAITPVAARVPPGGRLQLRHVGGPPAHLASLHYEGRAGHGYIEVSPSGSVHGVSMGTARVKLIATDIGNVEMASAESEIEVIPISSVRVRAGSQTVLVGSPTPLWLEAGPLPAAALAALQPPPRVSFSVRDPSAARLYTTHFDDKLERSVAEGLSVRVVPLKPGVIIIDVRVRNLGQVAETRSWDSTIEILGISEIRTFIDGEQQELSQGDRLAIAVGSNIRLKALPRGNWKAYEDGAFELTSNGEVKAQRPGYGVIVAQHRDDRNNIYRESAIHVQVSVPVYCTAQAGGEGVAVVLRDAAGRALLAPHVNVSAAGPLPYIVRPPADSVHGPEIIIKGLDSAGAFMTFEATSSGVTVKDEVWVAGTDAKGDVTVATAGWALCLDGVNWRAPASVSLAPGASHSLALLARAAARRHTLRQDRTHATLTIHQLPLDKMSFLPGEWPSTLVPLSFSADGLSSGPSLCTEEQRYALDGVQVELPFTCLTKQPHTAEPVIDIVNDQIGCRILSSPSSVASDVELCAEWGMLRTCTRVMLLPPIRVSSTKVSLLTPPAVFTIIGHPKAISLVKLVTSPGLKLDIDSQPGEMTVIVSNEASTCGIGYVSVKSKLTSQELRVDVERPCAVACGSLLAALLALLAPYSSTLLTMAAVAIAYMYIQSRLNRKALIRLPTPVVPTPPPPPSPLAARPRTWSRSPYSSTGPSSPVYGDASTLPDSSFSPTSTRTHSRFL